MAVEAASVNTGKGMKGLLAAVRKSDEKMWSFREQRKDFIKHFCGEYYGENAGLGEQPLNLIYSSVCALLPSLAVRSLSATVTAPYGRRVQGDVLKLKLDDVIQKLGVSRHLRRAVRDAIFTAGIVKTARAVGGELRVQPISLDKYILDYRCEEREPGSYAYEGNRFRVSLAEAMEWDFIDGETKDAMKRLANSFDQPKGGSASDTGSRKTTNDQTEYDPQVELIELAMRDGSAVWLPGNLDDSIGIVREFTPDAAPGGLFDMLGFVYAPDNPIPVPLLASFFDLYLLENVLANKIGQGAREAKRFSVVDSDSKADALAIRDARNGETLHVPGMRNAKNLEAGGVPAEVFSALSGFHSYLTRIGGNSDLAGGTEAQSKTLGQDQILLMQTNKRLADMSASVYEFCTLVLRKVAWFTNSAPDAKPSQHVRRVPGGTEVVSVWTPGKDLSEFVIRAGGLAGSDTPEDQYNRLADFTARFVVPLAPLGAATGSHAQVDVIANQAARLLNLPDAEDIWIEAPEASPAMPGPASPEPPGSPSLPGTSRPGQPSSPIEDMGVAALQGQGA